MTHLSVNPNMIPPGTLPICQYVCHHFHPSNHIAKFMVKIPTSIAGQNFPKVQYLGNFPSIHTLSDSSVDPSGSPSVSLSPSAENTSKFPSNHGEKNVPNCLHEILAKIPKVHSSSAMSVIPPIHASSLLSDHPSDDKYQEILDEFHCTIMGRNTHLKS